MKLEKLVGERFKERPSECQIESHAIMVKGGYKKLFSGLSCLSFPQVHNSASFRRSGSVNGIVFCLPDAGRELLQKDKQRCISYFQQFLNSTIVQRMIQ